MDYISSTFHPKTIFSDGWAILTVKHLSGPARLGAMRAPHTGSDRQVIISVHEHSRSEPA